jgi:hypothetical protein
LQATPAHERVPLHAARPVDPGQQGSFAAPQAHVDVLLRHASVELQVVPLQQACPGPPQPHVPLVHVRFVPQYDPLQQTWVLPPHGTQDPLTHW